MNSICIAICLVLAFSSLINRMKISKSNFIPGMKNPTFLFCMFWGFVFVLQSLNICGFDVPSEETYVVIMVGIISFSIGAWFRKNTATRMPKELKDELDQNLLIILGVVGCLYETQKMFRAIQMLKSGNSIAMLRKMYWTIGSGITTSTLDYILDNFLIKGISLMLMSVVFVELFHNNLRRKKLLCFFALYMAVSSSVINGGRIIFVDLILFVFFGFWISYKKSIIREVNRRLHKKAKRILIVTVPIVAVALVVLTELREGNRYSFLEALASNYTVAFPLLSKTLELVKTSGDCTYGMIAGMGFLQPILMVFQYIGLINYPEAYDILTKYITPYFNIGGVGEYNCYVTQFFYFFLDFRMLGVVVFDLMFGFCCMHYYKKAIMLDSPKYCAIYVLILTTLFRSTIRFSFSQPSYVIAVLLIYLVYGNKLKMKS